MIIRKAMYGCGLYFFIKLAYNSPILCKFAAREPAKPLNDAQMCGSFLFIHI